MGGAADKSLGFVRSYFALRQSPLKKRIQSPINVDIGYTISYNKEWNEKGCRRFVLIISNGKDGL